MSEIVAAYNTEAKRQTIEDFGIKDGGVEGFRIRWKALDHWVDFEVFKCIGCECLPDSQFGPPEFERKDATNSLDSTTDIDEAEPYLTGSIKWDGCSDIEFGYHHWCGPGYWQTHIELLGHLWRTAFELMGQPLAEQWDCPLDTMDRPKTQPPSTGDSQP
jgi:hypothetical protein